MSCNLQASSSQRNVVMRFSSCQEFRVSASITSFERLNDFRGPEIMIPELGAAGCGVEI